MLIGLVRLLGCKVLQSEQQDVDSLFFFFFALTKKKKKRGKKLCSRARALKAAWISIGQTGQCSELSRRIK